MKFELTLKELSLIYEAGILQGKSQTGIVTKRFVDTLYDIVNKEDPNDLDPDFIPWVILNKKVEKIYEEPKASKET